MNKENKDKSDIYILGYDQSLNLTLPPPSDAVSALTRFIGRIQQQGGWQGGCKEDLTCRPCVFFNFSIFAIFYFCIFAIYAMKYILCVGVVFVFVVWSPGATMGNAALLPDIKSLFKAHPHELYRRAMKFTSDDIYNMGIK